MNALLLQFLMTLFAGWVNRHQQDVIEYLQEENRALREQLGGKRLRFTAQQRRRLAVKAKAIGRKRLFEIETLVTPDTLFRWYRELIAKKYDGSKNRRPGRPRTAVDIEELVLRMARAGATREFEVRSTISVMTSHETQSNGSFSITGLTRFGKRECHGRRSLERIGEQSPRLTFSASK